MSIFSILIPFAYVYWVMLHEYWSQTKNVGYLVSRPSNLTNVIRICAAGAYTYFLVNNPMAEFLLLSTIGFDIFYSYRDYMAQR